MKTLLMLFGLLLALQLKADGPPINDAGYITEAFVEIDLTGEQIEHLQKNRYLVLTNEQRKKMAFLRLPKVIGILDPFYHDCTCGLIYGIWYKKDKVAFALSDFIDPKTKKHYETDEELFEYYNEEYDTSYSSNELFIGTEGRLYYEGREITLEKVKKVITKLAAKKVKSFLVIYQPPRAGKDNQAKVKQSRNQLKSLFPEKFEIWWM